MGISKADTIFLYGDGVDDALVEDMASRLCLASLPDRNGARISFNEGDAVRTLALIADVDGPRLERAAKRSHCSYFEISELDDEPSAGFIDWIRNNGSAYSLTTRTAYRMPVAHHICSGLAGRLRISKHRRDEIELALHEAIVNAAIHGNLAVYKDQENSMEDIVEFYRISEERVADPQYACLRVDILVHWQSDFIEFMVIDQGDGFSVKKENHEKETAPWKGLNLISSLADSVTTGGKGNNIKMKFVL